MRRPSRIRSTANCSGDGGCLLPPKPPAPPCPAAHAAAAASGARTCHDAAREEEEEEEDRELQREVEEEVRALAYRGMEAQTKRARASATVSPSPFCLRLTEGGAWAETVPPVSAPKYLQV